MSVRYSIGIDIGGTSIKAARYSPDQGISQLQRYPTIAEDGSHMVRSAIDRVIAQYSRQPGCIGIGVGTPGLVDREGYLLGAAVNIPGWKGIQIKDYVEKAAALPAVVANDAGMASYGEWKLGAGRIADPRGTLIPAESILCLALGTGIGGGIIINGKLLVGPAALAGEIGHVVLEPGGRLCNCGLRGCLERYASATGIAESAVLFAGEHASPLSQQILSKNARPDAKEIYHALEQGDALAQAVHRETCMRLAQAVGIISQTINPDIIIFGGGVLEAGDIILDGVRGYLDKYVMPQSLESVRMTRAMLGDKAGVYGAALMAWDSFGQ